MKKTLIILFISLVIISGIAMQLSANKEAAAEEIRSELGGQKLSVQVAALSKQAISNVITATGTVHAGQTLSLTADTDGKVEKILFTTGDKVIKGQRLLLLDADLKRATHRQTGLNYDKARHDYERLEALYQENNASLVEVENARLQMQTLENELAITAKQLSLATIYSPISGTVLEKKVSLGEYLQPGSPLATLVDISGVLVRINLPEQDLIRVREGGKVQVQAAIYPEKTFAGTIKAIIPQATQAKTFPVEITVNNPAQEPLLVGMDVEVKINSEEKDSILALPRTALSGDFNSPSVYIIKNKQAVKTPITLGKEYGTWLEVKKGLEPGDLVIVSGQQNVEAGSVVTSYSFVK